MTRRGMRVLRCLALVAGVSIVATVVAVGNIGLAAGSASGSGTAWSHPSFIDGTGDLTSISCPTASFCAAVDLEGVSTPHLCRWLIVPG